MSFGDKLYLKFSDAFEDEFIRQDEYETREIHKTLDIGWKLMNELPVTELKRVRDEFIKKYYRGQK